MDIAEYFRYTLGVPQGPGCRDSEQFVNLSRRVMINLATAVASEGTHGAEF